MELITVLLIVIPIAFLMMFLSYQSKAMEKERKKAEKEIKNMEHELAGMAAARNLNEETIRSFMEDPDKPKKRTSGYDSHTNSCVQDFYDELRGCEFNDELKESIAIINALEKETEERKAKKIERFFNRYLPLMTEILLASKTGETSPETAIKTFNDITKEFEISLYN